MCDQIGANYNVAFVGECFHDSQVIAARPALPRKHVLDITLIFMSASISATPALTHSAAHERCRIGLRSTRTDRTDFERGAIVSIRVVQRAC